VRGRSNSESGWPGDNAGEPPGNRRARHLSACPAAKPALNQAMHESAHDTMTETTDGGGHFIEVVLRPRVTVALSSGHEPRDAAAVSGSRSQCHRDKLDVDRLPVLG
jgi:hypothetical protein